MGIVARIDISTSKCYFLFDKKVSGAVTSIDTHPRKDQAIMADVQGFLRLYDLGNNLLINMKFISSTGINVVKYSINGETLVCGMKNAELLILNPITLETNNNKHYKYSNNPIVDMKFSPCGNYLAYSDTNNNLILLDKYNLIGKMCTHSSPIRSLIFTSASPQRLFSLGEDQDLVEYDLENSGPHPDPGLKVLKVDRIERDSTPLYASLYPEFGVGEFILMTNDQYKYKILEPITRKTLATYLGPTSSTPIKYFQILSTSHMIFATDFDIGYQLLPMDVHPFQIKNIKGHGSKIKNISLNGRRDLLLVSGLNDSCVFLWKINYNANHETEINPYYKRIESGYLLRELREMFDYFYTKERVADLMRAVGFFPTPQQSKDISNQISQDLNIQDFIKLYVNHRPPFGITVRELLRAFETLSPPRLSQEQFFKLLTLKYNDNEPLTKDEASNHLKILLRDLPIPQEIKFEYLIQEILGVESI